MVSRFSHDIGSYRFPPGEIETFGLRFMWKNYLRNQINQTSLFKNGKIKKFKLK